MQKKRERASSSSRKGLLSNVVVVSFVFVFVFVFFFFFFCVERERDVSPTE